MSLTLWTAGKNPSHSQPQRADALEAETVEKTGRSEGERNRSHESSGCGEVLPGMPAYSSTARGPFQAPWLLGEEPAVGGPLLRTSKWSAAGPWAAGRGAARAADLRGQLLGRRGCPGARVGMARRCPGQGLSPTEERAAPRAARPPPQSAAGRRGVRLAVFSQGPAAGGGCLCSAHQLAPSRRAEGRKARARRPHPRGSAVTLKSQLLSKWGQYWGVGDQAEGDVLSAPRAGGHPTSRQTNQSAQAAGSGTHSKSQHHAVSLRGLSVTLASLRAGASGEAGRKEESDLKSHSSSLPSSENVAGRAAGGTRTAHPPLTGTGSAVGPAPPRSQTPSLLIGGRGDTAAAAPSAHTAHALAGPEGTRRWRQGTGAAEGTRCGAGSSAAAPGHPLSASQSAAAARRLPGAQLPGSPPVRAHPERVGAPGEQHRAG